MREVKDKPIQIGELVRQLLDILGFHIKQANRRIASLTPLRSEIVDYWVRILDILNGKAPVVR